MSFADRLAQAEEEAQRLKAQRKKEKANLKLPHLANLNEDELLTNKVQFPFKDGKTRVGRSSPEGDDDPEICLAGIGIQKEHAVVENKKGTCWLTAIGQASTATF